MKKLHAATIGIGVSFLIYLVWRVGARELWIEIRGIGWGLAPLIFSEGVANLMHAAGWRHCLDAEHRGIRLFTLFRLSMAGFAINYLTPSASLAGEVTKAACLSSGNRAASAASSVLLDKLCLATGHLLVVVLGAAVVLWRMDLPPMLRTALVLSTTALAGGIGAFLILQKEGKLGMVLRWLAARRIGGRRLVGAAEAVSAVDDRLKDFFRQHPVELLKSATWHFLGHAMAVLQTWYFFRLLGSRVVLLDVLCASILCLWFDLLTFAIPLNLGAMEGSRMLALRQVGYSAVQGMAYGTALRIAQLFWAAFGLASYGAAIWSERRNKACAPWVDSSARRPQPPRFGNPAAEH